MIKAIIAKLIKRFMPKGIQASTPLKEVLYSFKGNEKQAGGMLMRSLVFGTFTSGFIYQALMVAFHKKRSIVLLSCFKYAFTKMFLPTIIIMVLWLASEWKIYKALAKKYVKDFDNNIIRSKTATYGDAHFQEEEEMEENGLHLFKNINDTDMNLIGIAPSGKYIAFTEPAGLNRNKLFVGSAGSGKSAVQVKNEIYQSAKRGESLIISDSKGDVYRDTSAVLATDYGYNIKMINLKPTELQYSDGFNPLHILKEDSPTLDAYAAVIAETIVRLTENGNAALDYWAKNELNVLKAVIIHKAIDPDSIARGENNLPAVLDFFNKPTCLQEMATIFGNMSPYHPARIAYDIFNKIEKQEIKGQILNGLTLRLQTLSNPILRKILSNNEVDFIEPMKSKCAYYIVISDKDQTYRFITSLLYSCMFFEQVDYSDSLSREDKEKQLFVNYVCDEYYSTGGIHNVDNKIATVRSRKIGLTFILQDIKQMEIIHPEKSSGIFNNIPVKCCLSTNDPDTAIYFCDLFGDYTAIVENERVQEGTGDVVHMHTSNQITKGEGAVPLMKPEHFWNGKLKRDECVYQISGMPPLKVKKCFAEKQGVRIHPMEIRGGELGDRRTVDHIPMWRKKEIAAQKREEERLKKLTEKNASANNAPKSPQTAATPQSATAPQTTGTQQQQYVAPPTTPTAPQGTQEQAQTQTTQTQQAKTPNAKPVATPAEQEATATAPAPQTQQKPTSSYKEIVSADVL